MTERHVVSVGPWPDPPPTSRLVSMTADTFEELVDELGRQAEQNARLRAALAVRPAVSLATGVLMFRYGIGEQEALDLLARWSDQNGTGLREFACSVLEVVARDPESLEVELLGVLPRDLPLRRT